MALTTCVATFYFNDLSLALGKTENSTCVINLGTSISIKFFTFIGILQINENNFLFFCL